MKRHKAPRIAALSALLFLAFPWLLSCCTPYSAAQGGQGLRIMSWNVLSLFDGLDDGNEYSGFSVARGEWSEAKYRARLDLIANVILRAGATGGKPGPDICCLVEIEKKSVLDDLAGGPLSKAGYRYRAFAAAKGSPIGVGILSRQPLADAKAWGLSYGERAGRPVLEARVERPGGDLVIFLCHWKSKLEGAEKTEAERREAARLLGDLFKKHYAEQTTVSVIACGDFNENPDESARTGGRYGTAFERDPGAAGKGDAIILGSRSATLAASPPGSTLYSPWDDVESYSYSYKGNRERIDGFVLGPSLLDGHGLDYAAFRVLGEGLMDSSGNPIPWSRKTGTGWSDHLPILLELSSNALP
ncbi:MAG: endonuclease/exonuclease/phosphatase family protein [Spirochaetota bacterium]